MTLRCLCDAYTGFDPVTVLDIKVTRGQVFVVSDATGTILLHKHPDWFEQTTASPYLSVMEKNEAAQQAEAVAKVAAKEREVPKGRTLSDETVRRLVEENRDVLNRLAKH